MKITLEINDSLLAELQREAAVQNREVSEIVESALQLLLRSEKTRGGIPPLPTFHSGGPLLDISDRDALYQAMVPKE